MADMKTNTDPRVLVLAPGDNVAVAKSDIPADTTLQVMGVTVTLKAAMETGHKFAFLKAAKGRGITKYGPPIGVATKHTNPGDSTHSHNVTSDYIPTYPHDEGHKFFKEH